ncbi:MAG TPA: NAD-dependent epimerase/dehydratase family protein [Woeseiaceae bacterium]|jgi:nucleoside-diphosphate-sugar epimerase|nr:NAD-dependent epimerase/dehydratase family protein [Woeseiaceae bacterium]
MKVLITGGTGFIGSRLAFRCAETGHDVAVLGREDASEFEIETRNLLSNHGVDVFVGSVTDRERMFEITRGVDIVFHLAAAQHEMNVPDEVFRNVNIEGTRNMLDASIEAGVERFVHGSSIGVYDRDVTSIVDETTPLKPDNIYGVTKAEGEKVVKQYFDKQPSTIIRISETYGPGDRRLLKLFRGINKGVFFVIGNGQNIHQLIYVDDLVDGLLLTAEHSAAVGETFVLAGNERLTTDGMVAAIAHAVGVPQKRWRAPLWPFMAAAMVLETTLRPLGIQPPLHRRRMDFFTKSFQISTEKAQDLLGFRAKTDFARGARLTAEWYRENGLL